MEKRRVVGMGFDGRGIDDDEDEEEKQMASRRGKRELSQAQGKASGRLFQAGKELFIRVDGGIIQGMDGLRKAGS
jgi:hypothetical protein